MPVSCETRDSHRGVRRDACLVGARCENREIGRLPEALDVGRAEALDGGRADKLDAGLKEALEGGLRGAL